MADIDGDVVLVAEGRNGDVDRGLCPVRSLLRSGELHRPAGVAILVPEFGRPALPILGDMAFADGPPLLVGVALLRCCDQAGVDDLTGHGDIARGPQRGFEALEQALDRLCPCEFLPEQPDRPGVGHAVVEAEPEDAHERKAVVDQEFRAFVGQVVGGLDDQNLEHHHRIERRAAAALAIRIAESCNEVGAEHLEVDGSPEGLQLIAEVAQSLQPIVEIEEPGCLAHRIASNPSQMSEPKSGQDRHVFRTVQLVYYRGQILVNLTVLFRLVNEWDGSDVCGSLAVDDAGRWAGLTPFHLAGLRHKVMADRSQQATVPPVVEITLHGGEGREVPRQQRPGAAARYQIEDRIHDIPQIRRPGAPQRPGVR